MALNYSLSGDGVGSVQLPGKKKKVKKQQPAQAGTASREARMKRFSGGDHTKVAQATKINTQTQKSVDEGLQMNEYGAPKGTQQHKKYSLFTKKKAKF
jgi:hypothetical protein